MAARENPLLLIFDHIRRPARRATNRKAAAIRGTLL